MCRGVKGTDVERHSGLSPSPPWPQAPLPPLRPTAAACLSPPPPSPRAGYARVLFAAAAFACALRAPGATVLAYLASFACDELDGRFARLLDQTSTFGAVRQPRGQPQCPGLRFHHPGPTPTVHPAGKQSTAARL